MLSPVFAAILSSLLHGSPAAPSTLARAEAAETAVLAAVLAESPAALRDRDARIMFVFGFGESRHTASPIGDNDRQANCGVVQTNARQWATILGAWDCAAIRADMTIGFRAGLRILHALEVQCGSFHAALGAYASGKCRTDMRLTRDRCLMAGLGAKCEAKP